MRYAILVAFVSVFLSGTLRAQQADSPSSRSQTPNPTLNETQKQGRLLFQQRCPICHSSVMITHRPYAPVLFKGLVEGNEEQIHETIANGRPGRMPAFKYGLSPSEIDAIVEYLKTVTAPFEMHPKGQPDAGSQNANPNATE